MSQHPTSLHRAADDSTTSRLLVLLLLLLSPTASNGVGPPVGREKWLAAIGTGPPGTARQRGLVAGLIDRQSCRAKSVLGELRRQQSDIERSIELSESSELSPSRRHRGRGC